MRLIDATLVLVVVTATAGLTGSRLTAQTATRATGREIERVAFRGVRSVPMEQVQRVLTTRASSVIRRRHLEPGQLASDVAGLHDLYWRHGFRDVAVDTTVSQNQLGPRVLRVRGEDLVANGCTDASIADGSCDPNAVPRECSLRSRSGRRRCSRAASSCASASCGGWAACCSRTVRWSGRERER